mgnify:CR=1 FL=1
MPKAYVIAHVKLKNSEMFMAEYASKVGGTVESFGGKFLVRGGEVSYQDGEPLGEDINVIIEFPDRAAALSWQNSSEYQEILPARQAYANVHFMIVDGLPGMGGD